MAGMAGCRITWGMLRFVPAWADEAGEAFRASVVPHPYLRCFWCEASILVGVREMDGAPVMACLECARFVDTRRIA